MGNNKSKTSQKKDSTSKKIEAERNKVKKKKLSLPEQIKMQWEEFSNATASGNNLQSAKNFVKRYNLVFKTVSVGSIILGLIVSAIFIINMKNFLWILLWPAIIVLCNVAFGYYYKSTTKKTTRFDTKYNISEAYEQTCGSAQPMQEEEQAKTFFKGDYYQLSDIIIGELKEDPGKFLSIIRDWETRLNGNILMIGNPGSGKSRCFIFPNLMQILRKRESAIITDSKGELYGVTAEMARARGYDVKLINFDYTAFAHSDGVSFFEGMKGNDYDKAMNMASTIIDNSMGAHESEDFFSKMEKTLLQACILLAIDENSEIIEPSIGGIYNYVSTHTPDALCIDFDSLPESHPAKSPFNIYRSSGSTVMGNALGGLAIRLTIFQSPLLQKITSTPEVDFLAPGKKPCFYYVSMSDQNRNYTFLIALFFECLISGLVSYADSLPERHLPVKVNLMLDEFYSCGNIPHFAQRLSNIRSRGMDTVIILQSMGQLKDRFPDGLDESVVDCCSLEILLGTNSTMTAEHFSKRSGIMTIRDYGERRKEGTFSLATSKSDLEVTYSNKSRPVYTVDEVQRIDSQSLLCVVAGHNVIELGRVDYSRHPMCKEIRPANTSTHRPKWVDELEEYDYEMLGISKDEKWEEEGWWDIALCTVNDFKEEWNPQKEMELQERIKREKAIHDRKISAEEYDRKQKKTQDIERQKKMAQNIKQHIADIHLQGKAKENTKPEALSSGYAPVMQTLKQKSDTDGRK